MIMIVEFSAEDPVPEKFSNARLAEMHEHRKQTALTAIRAFRNKLLAESDWTQMPDVTLTAKQKTDWLAYRQALRDFPNAIDWTKDHIFTAEDFPILSN
jgi:hypothetical protein